MEYIELSNEKLNEASRRLYKKIRKDFNYDCVIFVAQGAFLIGKALSDYNEVPLIEICAKRTKNEFKKKLSPILKVLPRNIKKNLRKLEIKIGIHEKNYIREISFEKKIWETQFNKKKILIVDDSADTGNTLKYVKKFVCKFFSNSEIKIAVLNCFAKAKKKINIDYYLYEDTILIGPWSNDSKNNKLFLSDYKKWKLSEKSVNIEEKISVIVPIYNTEKYLKRCIESIINQDYQNLEIILIDDGSIDQSGKICDYYSEIDSRISVLHQKNKGLAFSRNIGIRKSTGKYITFVDSDDFVCKSYISSLYKLLKETSSDISCCSLLKLNKQKKIKLKNVETIKEFNNIEAIREVLYQRMISNSSCAKLYKRDLFKNIKYPNDRYFEDLATTYRVLLEAKKIVVTNQNYYCYFQRSNSIMHKVTDKNINDLIYVIKNMNKNLNSYKDLENAVLARTINACFYIYINSKNKKLKKESKKYIKKYRKKVLNDKNIHKKTFFGIIISYFGFYLVNLLYVLKKILK